MFSITEFSTATFANVSAPRKRSCAHRAKGAPRRRPLYSFGGKLSPQMRLVLNFISVYAVSKLVRGAENVGMPVPRNPLPRCEGCCR